MTSIKDNYHYPKLIKLKMIIFLTFINLSGFVIISFLKILKPFKLIKLIKIYDNRIGEFALRMDTFLRHLQLKTFKKERILYIGISSGRTANNQLLKMFKRKLCIIQFPYIETLNRFISAIFDEDNVVRSRYRSLFPESFPFYTLSNSAFYQPLTFNNNEFYEYNNTEKNLHFTNYEKIEGKKLLHKIGVGDNDWYVCFHSRDPIYMEKGQGTLDKTNDYRNCDIKNYLKAAEYIASSGGFAIRMGSLVSEKLPYINNLKIIDYAFLYRTDFGDIYLPATCKFFLGNSSGLYIISTIFHIPIACANYIPLEFAPFREGDLFIPKKIWSIKKRRFLTFREILDSKMGRCLLSEQYIKAGLKVIENTAEEILDLVIEMNQRLDGTFKSKEEDEELQNRFRSLFKPNHICYGTPARIGTEFLRKNKELLK